jgi:hypothetical protein
MSVFIKVKLVCDVCGKKKDDELLVEFRRKGGVISNNGSFSGTWGRTFSDNTSIVCGKKCAAKHSEKNPPPH